MSFLAPASPRGRARRQSAIRRQHATLPLSTAEMVANIVDAYHEAVSHNARSWYAEAHAYAVEVSLYHDVPLDRVCGIIAALSPSTAWERNLVLAIDMIETGDCAHAYGDAVRKARKIRNGSRPEDVLGGRKVRSFYRNLFDPSRPGAVTVDRHAYSIALAGREDSTRTRTLHDSELKRLDRPGVYHLVAGAYRSAARSLGILPQDLQSITWDWWRDQHAYGTTTNVERF